MKCAGFSKNSHYSQSREQHSDNKSETVEGDGELLSLSARQNMLPVSKEANSCQFKAEQRRSNSCFSYRVWRDGCEAPSGKKKIHTFKISYGRPWQVNREMSIAQLFDCFTCHRFLRAPPWGLSLDAASGDERRFCQQSRNVR